MMLRHLGLDHYANRLSTATYNVLAEGYPHLPYNSNRRKTLTRDLKGTASTGEFTRAILNALETVKVEEPQL
jgi:isocitrate dehydrogenase (NAD+)